MIFTSLSTFNKEKGRKQTKIFKTLASFIYQNLKVLKI